MLVWKNIRTDQPQPKLLVLYSFLYKAIIHEVDQLWSEEKL